MRHIDDAHDAKGDRQADRREQQDRGGRKAIPKILRRAPQREACVNRGESGIGRALDGRVARLLRDLVNQALRVLVAALFQRGDRRQAILRRRAVAGRDDRRAGELECAGDARIAFLGELRLEGGRRLGVTRPEHVLSRREALLRIRVGERHRTDRAFDRPAQRVVEANLLEGGSAGVRNRFARPGVDERASRRLVGDEMIGGVEQKTIVAEGVQYRGGLRWRLRRQLADRLLGLRKFVVEKSRQGVVERVRLHRSGEHQQCDEQEQGESVSARDHRSVRMGEAKGVRQRHGSPSGCGARWVGGPLRPFEALRAPQGRTDARPSPRIARRRTGVLANALCEERVCGDSSQPNVSRRTCPS